MNDASMNVWQTDISASKAERQLFVMNPKLMQYRGMDVVNLKSIFRDRVSEFIGLAKCRSSHFTGLDDNRVVEKTARFQIKDRCRNEESKRGYSV